MSAHFKSHSTSKKSSDTFFSPNIFDYHIRISNSKNKNQLLSNDSQDQSQEQLSADRKNSSEHYMTF